MKLFVSLFYLALFLFAHAPIHSHPFNLDEVKAYLEKKFSEARVETAPYPHLIIENILPENLYAELETNWPGDLFLNESILAIGKFPTADQKTAEIWNWFATQISNPIIKKRVADLFRPYASYKFGCPIDGSYLCNAVDISEHRLVQSFSIEPHLDQGYIYAPVMIYMPATNNNIELGTQLLLHVENKTSLDVLYENESLVKLVKTAPYKRNTLFSFMRTPNSWHRSTQPFDQKRRFYFSNIYLTETFMIHHYQNTFFLRLNNIIPNENDAY